MADVKNICKYTYLFYVKHHGRVHTDTEWIEIMAEAKQIEKEYESEYAKAMLIEILLQLEREEMEVNNR